MNETYYSIKCPRCKKGHVYHPEVIGNVLVAPHGHQCIICHSMLEIVGFCSKEARDRNIQ